MANFTLHTLQWIFTGKLPLPLSPADVAACSSHLTVGLSLLTLVTGEAGAGGASTARVTMFLFWLADAENRSIAREGAACCWQTYNERGDETTRPERTGVASGACVALVVVFRELRCMWKVAMSAFYSIKIFNVGKISPTKLI